ncbi:T9SS type A sorting domain-containing protein [uncultured Draconibacterium sp.]
MNNCPWLATGVVVDFNGSSLPAGLYFYQLKVGNSATTRKMILRK